MLVDEQCRTSDPNVWAIGECAAPAGRMYGLVAPGYAMAEVVVDAILGGPGTFEGADMSTKLKLLGVDVASFGDAFATTEGALELVFADAVAGVYKKLVVSEDGTRLLGGILVGDASAYGVLRPMVSLGHPAAGQPGGADPPDRPRRHGARRCPTRPRSARATTSPSSRSRTRSPRAAAATAPPASPRARGPGPPAARASRW